MAVEENNMPVVSQQPQAGEDVISSLSKDFHLSAQSQKYSNDELKAGESGPEGSQSVPIEIPKKPMSEYVTVSLLCLCVALGGFMFGWDTGTISGFVAQTDFLRRFGMKHKDGTYYLSNVRTGLIVAIFNIGCAFGGIILSKAGDMYGRKKGLFIVVIVYIIGIIIQIASINKWYQYFIGRIISGLGVGGIAVLCPMLISEIAPKHLRGTLVSCYQLMITAGIFLGYCTNYGTKSYSNSVQWRVPLGLCFAWSLFMIGALTLVPESPRYLCEVNKVEDAKRSIAKSNKVSPEDPAVQAELDLIMAGVEAERLAGSASWGELFSTKTKVFQRLMMGILVQMFQQLTGNNYFFYYGTIVFKSVGLKDSFQTSIIIGVVNFASTFFSLWTVENLGRRKCLLLGAATMMACMVIYASVGVTRLYPNGKDQPSSKGAGNCMIVFTCFYIFCYATTWAPIAWVITAESFPLRVKSKCMALASASNWVWGFLIAFFTPFITSAINFYYGYVFMGCLVAMFFYVFFFVPETKGLSLEEIQELWEEGVLPWKSEGWIPSSRRGNNYDLEDLQHDDKPWYKAMLE
ncbi:Gal2p [Saccharomyces cerevisiae YJM1450]|nr:Gal2p [Saccharomyces cerevisiae YJM1450]CAI4612736.1 BDF_1d_G0035910.mRNA.1.CDS.1 [Saccharomyces cerevisiae]CAI4615738.1 BDC_1c_G0035980.mRNA.1.CDS.1 [Saccharomyces cerevisiae]CAI7230505.1 BDF_1d_G0035910.mRNA.1.CDS.1 [Saccharomyces cerevisiae]CAI7233463.1 BDC_1c_G0035980.mRNA.1.CDS.1 [Saccharomyces cerevisiae]